MYLYATSSSDNLLETIFEDRTAIGTKLELNDTTPTSPTLTEFEDFISDRRTHLVGWSDLINANEDNYKSKLSLPLSIATVVN